MAIRCFTVFIDEEDMAFIEQRWRQCDYFGAGDYLNGLLNTALCQDMADAGHTPRTGAGRRHKGATDLDDDIPF
jgi:hypothetical protein